MVETTKTVRQGAGHGDRNVDRIDTGPRFTEADAVRLNRLFRGTETVDWLRSVLKDQLAGDVAVVSSFGAESAVLLHLVAQIDPATPVLFLDTGKHFPETLAYRDLLVERLGLTDLVILRPDPAALAAKDESGLRWSYDPDGCCEIRKVEPLARALETFDASITGRKSFQASTRANLPRFEVDKSDAQGRLKINPLIDWSAEDITAYFANHDLPPHPLVAEGYPSIGCSPCTSRVAPGEDPRSGRWKGWDKTECGIHVPGAEDEDKGDELPPGFDPVF
jgi:phosphoadenosine phosphosulfate reductase